MISLEVLYAALLFFLLLKPQLIKNTTWFKLAVIAFAAALALDVVWGIFRGIRDTQLFFDAFGNGISQALLGVSIFFLLLGQVGAVSKAEAKKETKKQTASST